MLAFVHVLCVATPSAADWFCPWNGFYWALPAEAECSLRGVLSKQHWCGAFSPWRGTEHLSQSGDIGRWTQWLLLGLVEMLPSRSRLHHPGSDPGNGLSVCSAAKEPLHVPGSVLYLLLGVLCPVSSTGGKEKAVKWKETSQGLLGGQHCCISFTLKLLLHNASAK